MTSQTIAQIAVSLAILSFVAMFIWAHVPPGTIRTRKVGGLRFVWIGRLVFSFCITRQRTTPAA